MTESKVQRSLHFQIFTAREFALPDNAILILSAIQPRLVEIVAHLLENSCS